MYFLTALVCAIISVVLLFVFKERKGLHLEVLAIVFGAATIMWLIDCIFSAAKGEGFLSFSDPLDGWIALWTLLGGVFLWLVLAFILNNKDKVKEPQIQ